MRTERHDATFEEHECQADRGFDGNALPNADRHKHGAREFAELVLDRRGLAARLLRATQFLV